MNAETPGRSGQFHYWRLRFRSWRGSRPFWAGLLTMIGGVPIASLPYVNIKLGNMTLAMATTAGAGSLIIGVLLITLGLTMWFHAIVRIFSGVAAILLALVSIPVSNLGGFMIGFLFALLGGALAVSWVPGDPAAAEEGRPEAASYAGLAYAGPGNPGAGHPGPENPAAAEAPAVPGAAAPLVMTKTAEPTASIGAAGSDAGVSDAGAGQRPYVTATGTGAETDGTTFETNGGRGHRAG